MKDLEKILWLGFGVYGVYTAGRMFTNEFDKIGRKSSPGLLDLIALGSLGLLLYTRSVSTANQAQSLFSQPQRRIG